MAVRGRIPSRSRTSVVTAAGIALLTVCAAVTVGYGMLSELARNQDPLWPAFAVAGGILIGGTFLAIGVGG